MVLATITRPLEEKFFVSGRKFLMVKAPFIGTTITDSLLAQKIRK